MVVKTIPKANCCLAACTFAVSTPPPTHRPNVPLSHHALPHHTLQKIPTPAAGDTSAHESASFTAFSEVERVADALGLPPRQVDAVCAAVDAATSNAEGCRRFVHMRYRRLWRACCRGDVAVVRAWMEKVETGCA